MEGNHRQESLWNSSSVRERNNLLLETEFLSDITFVVGAEQEQFSAHKLILSSASPVFFSMLNGSFAESKKSEIQIGDSTPSAFRTMLKYIYSDDVKLDVMSATPTLYLAEKYELLHLKELCIEFIGEEASSNEASCITLLSEAARYSVSDFVPSLKTTAITNAEMILTSESFGDIDEVILKDILSSDGLNCDELVVFKAAMNWGSKRLNGKPAIGAELRSVLGPAFDLIRFSNMSPSEFVNSVIPSGLLRDEEVLQILKDISQKKKSTRQISLQSVGRFRSIFNVTTSASYHSIRFKVSHTVRIHSYGLFSPTEKGLRLSGHVALDLASPQTRLGHTPFSIVPPEFVTLSVVDFNEPVVIRPEVYYIASVVLDESQEESSPPSFYCGLKGCESVCVGGVTFSFRDSPKIDMGDTCVEEGQIPFIYFRRVHPASI